MVNATRNRAPTASATPAAALQTMPLRVCGFQSMAAIWCRPWSSVDSTIRAIVVTVWMGYSPTLVSPDSITASAPSSTALATSDASARVGRGDEIIDSSIWVATMTGLALRRARSMICFCTSGTSSSGSSTPRSPRATMKPSNASMISSRFSTACGFSIFAMSGSSTPTSFITLRTSSASLARRTNDSAMRSTGIDSAQRRSATSFSDIAGHAHLDPGQVDALVVAQRTRDLHHGVHVGGVDLAHPQPHGTVVEQHLVTRADVARQAGVGGRADRLVALDVAGRDRERRVLGHADRAAREPAESDLGALQVGEHPDRPAAVVGGLPDAAEGLLVVGMVAVAEVQPRDVHAGLDELTDPLFGSGRWAEGADDLGSTHERPP